MGFIGGALQERFTERVRGLDPGRLLAVPIDVGKHSTAALVCDFYGQLLEEPFTFPLTEPGVESLLVAVARAEAARDATWVRVGLEEAGHYHRTLLWRLQGAGLEVALLNPAQVKQNRTQDLLRSLKSDARDLGAMAELLIRGRGRPAPEQDTALLRQAALASHRARKVKARSVIKNHIHASLDHVFPGLSGCFEDVLDTKLGRLLVAEQMDPARVRRLGPERLRAFCAHRGVRVARSKARQVTQAARVALVLSPQVAQAHARVLAADIALLGSLDEVIRRAEGELEEILPHTPAGILTTIPRVAVVRASNYGGALGDPSRFRSASQVYRMAGLVPRLYESAGRRRERTTISREGKAELRAAIIELGRALRQGTPTSPATRESSRHGASAPGGGGVRPRAPGQPGGLRHGAGPGAVRSGALEVPIEKGAGASWPSELDHLDVTRPHKLAIEPPVEHRRRSGDRERRRIG
ncbi:MAG TPA: transposase [Actinomycetota bacterium]